MTTAQAPVVSDMLLTVKSREIQRALSAAMAKASERARRHFLAAAQLELVLASDYEEAAEDELARRSRISAASCRWRAGDSDEALELFDELKQSAPDRVNEIQDVITELTEA